jgi:hypothetical protein
MLRAHVVPDRERRRPEVLDERGRGEVEQRGPRRLGAQRFGICVHEEEGDLDEAMARQLTGLTGPRMIAVEITGPVTGTRRSMAGRW